MCQKKRGREVKYQICRLSKTERTATSTPVIIRLKNLKIMLLFQLRVQKRYVKENLRVKLNKIIMIYLVTVFVKL